MDWKLKIKWTKINSYQNIRTKIKKTENGILGILFFIGIMPSQTFFIFGNSSQTFLAQQLLNGNIITFFFKNLFKRYYSVRIWLSGQYKRKKQREREDQINSKR